MKVPHSNSGILLDRIREKDFLSLLILCVYQCPELEKTHYNFIINLFPLCTLVNIHKLSAGKRNTIFYMQVLTFDHYT